MTTGINLWQGKPFRERTRYIDYVIGMSKEIGDRAAIEFAVGFYDALGAGKSFEYAYQLGCRLIRVAGIPESLTPQLFKNYLQIGKTNITASFSANSVAETQFTSNINFQQETPNQANYTHQDLLLSANWKQTNIENMEVLLSYSPKDEKFRKELEKSLSILELQGMIKIWDESKITPGKNKKVEINLHLKSARIILLLISGNFLSSVYHRNLAKRAMERRERQARSN